jgi:hypothetical protein
MTVAPRAKPIWRATTVMTGIRAFLNTIERLTTFRGSPFARATWT